MNFYSRLTSSPDIFVMGILNVTPDSFSDGGKYNTIDSAVIHGLEMIENGADIVDIGGESSRPGAKEVSVNEELERTIPVIKKLLKAKPDAIISIDTVKPEVAEVALENGVRIINDISGLSNKKMSKVIKQFDASVVIMHMQGTPRTMQENPTYNNVVDDVYGYLHKKIEYAKSEGINKIIIDPGIGFGKTVEHNFELLKNLSNFQQLDVPLLIGVSRKSLIGKTLKLDVEKRDVATIILETDAVRKGAKIVRTHNVGNCVQLKKLNNLLN
jgi:dihydropteroate synthase